MAWCLVNHRDNFVFTLHQRECTSGEIILQFCQYLDYTLSHGRMTDEQQLVKDLARSYDGLIEVILWNLSGWSEENHESFQSG